MNDLSAVLQEVLRKIKPSPEECNELKQVAAHVMNSVKQAVKRRELDVDVILIGSAARNTWIAGDRDIDIFIGFDPSVPRTDLEYVGIEIGKEVAGDSYVIQYAEHPYVKAKINGFIFDIVPYYRVDAASRSISAVDRTPFHQQFVTANLNNKEDEVRLLKQFLKGTGVYGAELKIRGFSGYLCELLIIKYGSFLHLLNDAAGWKRRKCINFVNEEITPKFDNPLIVIDPVDPKRNVAAAVSTESFFNFIDSVREFLLKPCVEFFFPPPIEAINAKHLNDILTKRGTKIYAFSFKMPELVEDIAYPQLEKSIKSICKALSRVDFQPIRTDIYYRRGNAVLLLEFLVCRLPPLYQHIGPPVDCKEHAQKFKDKYMNDPTVFSGPFIQESRYVVEIPRKYLTVEAFMERQLKNLKLSEAVYTSMKSGCKILCNEDLLKIEDQNYREFLANYFRRRKWTCR
jgi:tRNA nucleotidyltransferase (CCA-adding enzyme)